MGNLKIRERPEDGVRERIRQYLQYHGWLVQIFHNDRYQKGPPDLFAWHIKHSFRWIDAKYAKRYSFTGAQLKLWPEWEMKKLGVWIMTEGDDENYAKLFRPPNWRHYLRPAELKTVNTNIEELLRQHDQETGFKPKLPTLPTDPNFDPLDGLL